MYKPLKSLLSVIIDMETYIYEWGKMVKLKGWTEKRLTRGICG